MVTAVTGNSVPELRSSLERFLVRRAQLRLEQLLRDQPAALVAAVRDAVVEALAGLVELLLLLGELPYGSVEEGDVRIGRTLLAGYADGVVRLLSR